MNDHPAKSVARRAPAPSPWLELLLAEAGQHRLHPALVLVALHRLSPELVLNLRWVDLDLPAHRLRTPVGSFELGAGTSALLHWHGCRQRLDRIQGEGSLPAGLQVFVDEVGHPYTESRADEVVADLARSVGLPPLTLGALRHPCLTH